MDPPERRKKERRRWRSSDDGGGPPQRFHSDRDGGPQRSGSGGQCATPFHQRSATADEGYGRCGRRRWGRDGQRQYPSEVEYPRGGGGRRKDASESPSYQNVQPSPSSTSRGTNESTFSRRVGNSNLPPLPPAAAPHYGGEERYLEIRNVPLEDNDHHRRNSERRMPAPKQLARDTVQDEDASSISSQPLPRSRSSRTSGELHKHRPRSRHNLESHFHSAGKPESFNMDDNSDSATFDADHFDRGGEEKPPGGFRGGRAFGGENTSVSSLRSFPSVGSMHRSGRSRHSHNDEDIDDDEDKYGRGRSLSSQSMRRACHGHRSEQMSDDMSYGGLLDEESRDGRGGGGDVWSINKSVFSTLPDRAGRGKRGRRAREIGSNFDDDDDMSSTYSGASSYSHRRGAVSRSSSIASRMSQMSERSETSRRSGHSASSHTSSFRFPRRNHRNNNYEYDSDDSIGSLIGGYNHSSVPSMVGSSSGVGAGNASHSDASSGSFLFDRKNEERRRESPSPTRRALDFGDTFTHLEDMGFGAHPSDGEGGSVFGQDEDDPDSKKKVAAKRKPLLGAGIEEKDVTAWWISDLEDEGWFEHDTAEVYSDKASPTRRQKRVGADTDEDEEESKDDQVDAPPSSVPIDEIEAGSQVDYEIDDTSTAGVLDEDDDVPDWEERLWSLARANYIEYARAAGQAETGAGVENENDCDSISRCNLAQKSDVDTTVDKAEAEADNQSIKDQEQIYKLEYDKEQRGIQDFRTLLLRCIHAYANSFHRKIHLKADCGSLEGGISGTASEKRDRNNEWSNHPLDLGVHQFVPLQTVRSLFSEVIRTSDSQMASAGAGKEIEEANHEGKSSSMVPDGSNDEESTVSVETRAGVVASVLVSDALNIFRLYQVVTIKSLARIKSGGGSGIKRSRRRLMGSSTKVSGGDAQAELENYLYGEMLDCDKEGDEDREYLPDFTETREHEVRMRSDVVRGVLGGAGTDQDDALWANSVICKVLLSDVQTIIKGEVSGERKKDNEDAEQLLLAYSCNHHLRTCSQDGLPMAQLYSLRYTPIFLLRSLSYQRFRGAAASSLLSNQVESVPENGLIRHQVIYENLSDLLYDEPYLHKRFGLQGPYDATITHLFQWQNAFYFRNNLEQCNRDDKEDYLSLHRVIASALYSHLKFSLVDTGYNGKAGNVEKDKKDGDNGSDGDDSEDTNISDKEGEEKFINSHNYPPVVATCLEVGRSLQHLGVCLGRRQRDGARGQNSCKYQSEGLKEGVRVESKSAEAAGTLIDGAVSLEVASYKDALEAYKAALYVLSCAETSSSSIEAPGKAKTDVRQEWQYKGLNEVPRQEREALSSPRAASGARTMPSDDLQDIREARISVELHLADTLNCLGYCHDAKLSEHSRALAAYRESLSLYIRHVGRFHGRVSDALHNMGAIYVELGQWGEAASCFRQCLAILKRRAEREQITGWAGSREAAGRSQVLVTLQCLGNSLAELGEYDTSIACFQEIVNERPGSNDTAADDHAGEVFSQMAGVHLNQASRLSRAFNRRCHLLLFSEGSGGSRKDEDPSSILAHQLRVEKDGRACIRRAIHIRRTVCYATSLPEDAGLNKGGIFSSADGVASEGPSSFSVANEGLRLGDNHWAYYVPADAGPTLLSALAKDLLSAARLEFRTRSYWAAISYCWESFLLSGLLASQESGNVEAEGKFRNMLVFDGSFLKSEGTLFKCPDTIVSALNLLGPISPSSDAGVLVVQLLFLIGISYGRTDNLDKARTVLQKALTLLEPARSSFDTIQTTQIMLEEVVTQLDIASLYLRVGFVDSEMGNVELAASNFKEAVQIFNSTHHIFSRVSKINSRSQKRDPEGGDDNRFPLENLQHKELEMALKNGLSSALHRMGQTYLERGRLDKAMKCLDDTAHVLNQIQDVRAEALDWKPVSPLPCPSRCFWEEVSAISTALTLSDAYERSGRIHMEDDTSEGRFSLQCFERAIGMREFITLTVSALGTVDMEISLESFEESKWDGKNMDCYSAILMLMEKREIGMGRKKSTEGEEKSWKIYHKLGLNADAESAGLAEEEGDSFLTKEDVLFRIGNLQVKSSQFNDAINSYEEAEELTVAKLGTKDHYIIASILHNLGNAYRAISNSSLSRGRGSARAKAIECYTESIRISRAFYGNQHSSSAAESMKTMAMTYMKAGNAVWLDILNVDEVTTDDDDDELAYKSFKESLLIRRRESGNQNELEIASTLGHLGDLCLRKIGYYHRCDDSETLKLTDDALSYLSESLKIRKVLFGQDHIIIGETYQSIGIAHLNRAMALKNDVNKVDLETSKAFNALSQSLTLTRNSKRSQLEIRGSISDALSNSNSDSKIIDEYDGLILMEACCLFYLGCVDEMRSNHEQAKLLLIDSLRLFQAEGKQRSSKVSRVKSDGKLLMELEAINLWAARALFHIAGIHKVAGSIEDAVNCYDEALRIRSLCQSASKHGLNNAFIHLEYARVLHDNENYDKSIECYSYSLRTYLAHFGKESLDVADTLTGMGKSFAMKSMFEKTMQCYEKAMRVYEYREGLVLKEKRGLLHREIANIVQQLNGDIFEVLEHYRSSVSFLEEFNERQRTSVRVSEKSDQDLLRYYSEMLAILRQVLSFERDSNIKAELHDEIGDVLHRMGNLHATFGEYDEAMGCFSEVLQALRRANNDELRIADLLFNMGNIYVEQCCPEKSLDCLHESYAITKEALGEDNTELHSTLYLMGVALTNLGDYDGASEWLSRAHSVLKSNDEDLIIDEVARGKTIYQLGTVHERKGDETKAIACFQESVQILKSVSDNGIELSNALNSMGNLLRNVSDLEKALDCYGQSLSIRIELGDELLAANTKNNIGAVLSAMGDMDRAMAFSAEALRVKTNRLGSDCAETARALVNMGQLYLDQRRFTSAERYFERGHQIFRQKLEFNHSDIAVCVHKLGVIREALQDDESALDCYLQSYHIFKSNGTLDKNITMAFSLHNAALIYTRRKDFRTALEFMIEALDVKIAALGTSHSDTAASQHSLGNLHLELEDPEAALFYFKDALKGRVECFGTEHIDVAGTLFGLASAHFVRDEFEEAIECLIENLRVLDKFGCGDGEVSQSELLLGSSYQELGQFDEAKGHLLEALDMMISVHGANHLDVAQTHFRLGICYCEKSQYLESLEKFQECLEVQTKLLGNLHVECANTYESIGIVQQKIKSHDDAIHSFERALAIKKTSLQDSHEDFSILLHFIGSSLFALKRYDDAVIYFSDSTERKKSHHGRADEEYAMSVVDLAAACAKTGNENRSMECYREAIESGGLSGWELGVAHKCLAGYFFDRDMYAASLERYREAVSIFEWNIETASSEAKYNDIIQCYLRLLDMEDEDTGPISEARAELCYKCGNVRVQLNKHEDAVHMYREAIMIQTQLHGTDHLSVGNSLHNLGNCYRDLCCFDKSADCLRRSLAISSINYDDENESEIADTCHCLALTLISTCELDEAFTLFERALSIRKKKLGALDLNLSSTLYNLAQILQWKGNWNGAMKYCKEALKIQRMTVGDNSPITASTLECIGRIHMDRREFENAMQCFIRCISQGKLRLQRECGVIHQLRGETGKAQKLLIKAGLHIISDLGLTESQSGDLDLLHLELQKRKQQTEDKDLLYFAKNVQFYGSILVNLEKFDRGLECYRFSNVIFQAKIGSDHLTLGENLHQTALIISKMTDDQYQLEEALELLTEALRIRNLHLVGSHPDLEETLLCLGKVHHKLGNIRDALDFLTEAVKTRDARLGRKHANINDADALLQVGQLHQQSGQFRQALDNFELCLDIRREILGRDHESIGELLFHIGSLLREVGDLDLAQVKFEESLEISEQTSAASADILFSLGVLHTEQKHLSLALDCYFRSMQIHKRRGSANTVTAEILNNIGITYSALKDFHRAQVYHSEALESLRQELGDDHVDVAFCWHSLGIVHQELTEFTEALECFQKAVNIERAELYLQSLGMCLVQMNDNENAYVCLDEALRMKTAHYAGNDADDDLAEIQRHLGIIWMRKKNPEESLKCFEEALKIKRAPHKLITDTDSKLINCIDGALEAVSEIFGTQHMKYARLLHQKGNIHGANNEHSHAIEAYVEALRIYKKYHGDSHLSIANTLFNLGVSLNAKGCPDKAIRCFTKALRITKARLGEEHLDVADTYTQVAESKNLLHCYGDATSYYEKALYIRKRSTGGNDLRSASIMHELGKLHTQEALWENAEIAFKESVRIRTIQLGQDDPLVAESMFNLGVVYDSRGDNSKALKYLEGSLRINKSKLTSSDPKLADNFRFLGAVHQSMGNIDKSVFCYDKSMQIYTCVQGEDNENVALSLAGKGEALCSDEQPLEALACFSKCLDIRKSIDGHIPAKQTGDVLSRMGEIYSQLGDSANASSSFASALTTYRHSFGTKHQTVADVLQIMSVHFVKVREFERAYSCVKEALGLRQDLLGQGDTKTADSHYCMGTILYEWNDYGEATKCFEKARDTHTEKLGRMHLSVANSNFYLGCISERKGDFASAVQYLQESLSGRRENLDEMDHDIASNLTRLGHVYFKQSEWDLSVTAFSDCLKIREATRSTDRASQINVAEALFDLGTALLKVLDSQRSMQLFADALKEYQRHLDDPYDVKIAQCHSFIGEIYEKTNELLEAVDALEKASRIYEHHIGSSDPTEKEIRATKKIDDAYSGQAETLFRLATAKDRLGEEGLALKQYRRAMRLYKSLFGRDNLHVAKILNRLANMKGRAGSVDKAMVLFDESLRIRMLHLGNNHEDVAETLFGMGIVFEKRRDYGAAMKAYSDCLRIRSSKFGSDSMEVAQVVVNIGVVRGNKGDFSGALKSWNKALSIYRKNGLGDDDALVATVLGHQRLANQLKRQVRNKN